MTLSLRPLDKISSLINFAILYVWGSVWKTCMLSHIRHVDTKISEENFWWSFLIKTSSSRALWTTKRLLNIVCIQHWGLIEVCKLTFHEELIAWTSRNWNHNTFIIQIQKVSFLTNHTLTIRIIVAFTVSLVGNLNTILVIHYSVSNRIVMDISGLAFRTRISPVHTSWGITVGNFGTTLNISSTCFHCRSEPWVTVSASNIRIGIC